MWPGDMTLPAAARPPRRPGSPSLTARQLSVLRLVGAGLDASDIARALHIDAKTVESHKRRIFELLDAQSQAQAVSIASKAGLLLSQTPGSSGVGVNRVALASGRTLFRELLRAHLERAGLVVVAECSSLDEMGAVCRSERPHLLLAESHLGGLSIEDALRNLDGPRPATLVVASQPTGGEALRLLEAGATGYLSLDLDVASLIRAISAASRGETPLDWTAATAMTNEWHRLRLATSELSPRPSLSPRERDVLEAMSTGATTIATARRLGVSPKTIEAHKTRIFVKLGATNQAHAVVIALERGLFAPTT
jgi:DNA-binding NarL/FixJ family response regulator